jgi:hypothetical protein
MLLMTDMPKGSQYGTIRQVRQIDGRGRVTNSAPLQAPGGRATGTGRQSEAHYRGTWLARRWLGDQPQAVA